MTFSTYCIKEGKEEEEEEEGKAKEKKRKRKKKGGREEGGEEGMSGDRIEEQEISPWSQHWSRGDSISPRPPTS